MKPFSKISCIVFAVMILLPVAIAAQEDEDADLAKQTQNPVADLISVPFQNNTNFGIGPHDRIQNILNIQPVVPFGLTENWKLIARPSRNSLQRTVRTIWPMSSPITTFSTFGRCGSSEPLWIADRGRLV